MDASDNTPILELDNITKRFPGILANDHVSLTLHRGEILALLGENGAGKSTLMNIIYGLYHADEGTIRLNGQEVRFASPREAIHSGIGMVHQHFQLIPVMTVAENVTLGEENTPNPSAPLEKSATDRQPTDNVIRRGWGGLWRVLLPLIAIVGGLLAGQVALLFVMVFSTHLVSGAQFDTFQFDRLPLADKATQALAVLYPRHAWLTTAFIWLPLVAACIVGAALMVVGYRHARRTWKSDETRLSSPFDSVINAVIDLLSTITTLRDRRGAAQRVRDLSQRYGLK